MRAPGLLLLGLAGAGVLYLYTRTPRGQQAAADAVELVTVTARRIGSAILPRGLRNNNPGNLRYIARNPWTGQVGQDGEGYGVYSTLELGVRAAAKQLLAYERRGLNTVRKMISTWAPSTENDTDAYVRAVASALAVAADAPLNVNTVLEELAAAIFRHELGAVAFATSTELTRANIAKWVRLS